MPLSNERVVSTDQTTLVGTASPKRNRRVGGALALAILISPPASTVNAETLNFRGLAVSSCSLGVPTDGVLSLSSNLQNWTTTTPATITAINTAPATLTITKPTSWTASPTGTPATTFGLTANLTGTNIATLSVTSGAGSATLSILGNTLVSVSLTAQGADTFKAGSYTAQATVTCAVN